MVSPVLLLIGAGPNIGTSVLKKFSAGGFKVASVSRSSKPELASIVDLVLTADLSDPSSVASLFDTVKTKLGAPSVVVYNAPGFGGMNFDPPPSVLTDVLNISAVSAYAALQSAVAGFTSLPSDLTKTFIYTGNGFNVSANPAMTMLGTGKAAGAHLIEAASKKWGPEGWRFYYADERFPDGSVKGSKISGQGHAEFYWDLAGKEEVKGVPWDATFVEGKGYVDFGGK